MSSINNKLIHQLIERGNSVLLGKEKKLKLAFACLFANGHLLINDQPGVGKTSLAHLLAKLLGLHFQRIQFTSDLLPADITGVSIFNNATSKFEFHPGPVFGQLLLADEINRASPKTQSALLEAMEERQVSIEGKTWQLPNPFFVIATQNPSEQAGTFPLPESQLDRFTLSIELGYPDRLSEREIFKGNDSRTTLEQISPLITADQVQAIQSDTQTIHTSEAILDYLQNLVEFTRNSDRIITGYSPRAGMALLRVAQSWAMIEGRDHVIPEDIQTIVPSTTHHLRTASGNIDAVQDIIRQVAIP